MRVLVVDSQRAFAEALAVRLRLEQDVEAASVATTTEDAVETVIRLEPDVITIDAESFDLDSAALARDVHERRPSASVVIVTGGEDVERALAAIEAGASAWVPKTATAEELLEVLRGVQAGGSWVPPQMLTAILARLLERRNLSQEDEARIARLTRREREILQCMAEGLDRRAIAERLYLSVNTVRTHTQHLLGKLRVHSALEAVAIALRAGLVQPGGGSPAPTSLGRGPYRSTVPPPWPGSVN